MADFFTEDSGPGPELIILDSQSAFQKFTTLTQQIDVGYKDVLEIIWQILDTLDTVDDNATYASLEKLPDFSRLTAKHILDDYWKEAKLKLAVKEFGQEIHQSVKYLGLYKYLDIGDGETTGFPYIFHNLISGKIVLKETKS